MLLPPVITGWIKGVERAMKHFSEKGRQWVWFVSLWTAGLAAVFALAQLIRWLLKIG